MYFFDFECLASLLSTCHSHPCSLGMPQGPTAHIHKAEQRLHFHYSMRPPSRVSNQVTFVKVIAVQVGIKEVDMDDSGDEAPDPDAEAAAAIRLKSRCASFCSLHVADLLRKRPV